jgi:hypothetical protein
VPQPAARHHPSQHTTARLDGYIRRTPEDTVLYQTIAAHWPVFHERMEDQGGLPKFIVAEFEQYLNCGLLEKGNIVIY